MWYTRKYDFETIHGRLVKPIGFYDESLVITVENSSMPSLIGTTVFISDFTDVPNAPVYQLRNGSLCYFGPDDFFIEGPEVLGASRISA